MDFSIKTQDTKSPLASLKSACLVVGVFEEKSLTPQATALEGKVRGGGFITRALKSGDMSGKAGSYMLLRDIDGIAAERVLLVGLGRLGEVSEKGYQAAAMTTARLLSQFGAVEALIALPFDSVARRDATWGITTTVLAFHNVEYRSDVLKSKRDLTKPALRRCALLVEADAAASARTTLTRARALASGMSLTKDLGNLPGNVCTPTYLADTARKLARDYKFGVQVLETRQMEALKMGSFLSVARGTAEPPKFIVLKHMGGKRNEAPVVLVGKGVTFDSGGISIKPGGAMDEMKYDMCGAASVLGLFCAIGELNPKMNVIGIVAATENMPSGTATKPGDIVTSMSGQTIEVLNTDAEGRLVLCDALTYAERFKPACVIDLATLTGACVTALGHHNSGLFTRDDPTHDELADALLVAGKVTGDTAWRMPLDERYQEQLKSNFADMANIGGPAGGAVTAACFLERYTRAYTWAHLDIAGTAWKGGAAKGASGRPVPLLLTFLLNRLDKKAA